MRDDRILLVRKREDASGRSYWVFPGGGIEPGETEEDCVQREMKEETNLDVRVVSLLLRKLGARTEYVLCVIQRDKNSAEALRKEGLRLIPLFTM